VTRAARCSVPHGPRPREDVESGCSRPSTFSTDAPTSCRPRLQWRQGHKDAFPDDSPGSTLASVTAEPSIRLPTRPDRRNRTACLLLANRRFSKPARLIAVRMSVVPGMLTTSGRLTMPPRSARPQPHRTVDLLMATHTLDCPACGASALGGQHAPPQGRDPGRLHGVLDAASSQRRDSSRSAGGARKPYPVGMSSIGPNGICIKGSGRLNPVLLKSREFHQIPDIGQFSTKSTSRNDLVTMGFEDTIGGSGMSIGDAQVPADEQDLALSMDALG
jgi:hypothetical protein